MIDDPVSDDLADKWWRDCQGKPVRAAMEAISNVFCWVIVMADNKAAALAILEAATDMARNSIDKHDWPKGAGPWSGNPT